MHLKSLFPDVPPIPDLNAHYLMLKRPDQTTWKDFTIYIDANTGRECSYREFVRGMYDTSTALGAPVSTGGLGLHGENGDIVGIIGENCIEFPTIVHACLAITTPFTLISAASTAFELRHALTVSKATRLFVQTKYLSLVLSVAKEIGLAENNIYLLNGHIKGRKSLADMIYEVRSRAIPPVEVRKATKKTLAYLIFSSGTGGLPKAVMISHGNIIFALGQLKVIAQAMVDAKLRISDGINATLAYLPMHHTFGLTFYCFRALLTPSTMVFLPRWDTAKVLELIPKYKIAAVDLIPSVVHQLTNYPGIDKANLSSLQALTCGAAALPQTLSAKLQTIIPKRVHFIEGFGMSELTITAIAQLPGLLDGRLKLVPGSIGALLPGMESRIVRGDGSEAGFDEPGELWLKGGNVAMGYWNSERGSRETFLDGWLRTGDRFKVDKDQNFFYVDRAKDTLKISGFQVSPAEIESVLFAHPKQLISDCTVAGVSVGPTMGEKLPRAWIVLSDVGKKLGPLAAIRELEEWHKHNLSKYKWLTGGIEIVEMIPKNVMGKTLRAVLQEQYEKNNSRRIEGKL